MTRPPLPSPPDLASEVREVVARVLGVPAHRVRLDDALDGELGIDSMRMIRINVALEARFGVVIPDDAPLRTIADLVASVTSGRTSEPVA